jgi:hypothetical protein
MYALAQSAYRTYMIRMIVRHKNAHDIGKIQIHLTQTFLDLACRDTRINQDAPLMRSQVVTVAATTARKTPKYKRVLVHIINSACKISENFLNIQIIRQKFPKIFDICKKKCIFAADFDI